MRIAILHNRDHTLLDEDPGREARQDVERVASALHGALTQEGHTVDLVPVEKNPLSAIEGLHARRCDVVMNLCESLSGDSRGEMVVPALLDVMHVPYTGNTAFTLALALHKNKAKEVLLARKVPTPAFWHVESAEAIKGLELPYPLIVKPSREDASVGIDFDSVVKDHRALVRAIARVTSTFAQPALVEHYVEGREIYVPLIGNHPTRALPLSEIHFNGIFEANPKVVSYRAKWEAHSQECKDSPARPAVLTQDLKARCVEVAKQAFEAIEGRDYARIDLRIDAQGQPWVIDLNPNCDLHPQAGFAQAALASGMSFAELANQLVGMAWERRHGDQAPEYLRQSATRSAAPAHRSLYPRRGVVRARTHRRRTQAE